MATTNPTASNDNNAVSSPTSPMRKQYTEEEEELFAALAGHTCDASTQVQLTQDQVRSIHVLFDKADHNKTGFVDSRTLEDKLLRIGDSTAHRVIRELVDEGVSDMTFPQFVKVLQQRLTSDEATRLEDTTTEYLETMGIDQVVKEEQSNFAATKERRSFRKLSMSGGTTASNADSQGVSEQQDSANSSTTSYRQRRMTRPHIANDEIEYLAEMGLDLENADKDGNPTLLEGAYPPVEAA